MKKSVLFLSIASTLSFANEALSTSFSHQNISSPSPNIHAPCISSRVFFNDKPYFFSTSQDGRLNKHNTTNHFITSTKVIEDNVSNLTLSNDGRFIILADNTKHKLLILSSEDLSILKTIPTEDKFGKMHTIQAVHNAYQRNTFIVAFDNLKEVWEISYETPPPMGFGKWMHDYRENAGENSGLDRTKNLFPVRQVHTKYSLNDFMFSPEQELIIGFTAEKTAHIIDLDLGRITKNIAIPASTGVSWVYHGNPILALPATDGKSTLIIDMKSWKTTHQLNIPSKQLYSHNASPYIWAVDIKSTSQDMVHILDKQNMKLVQSLDIQNVAHINFSPDGHKVVIQSCSLKSGFIIYDTHSLKPIVPAL